MNSDFLSDAMNEISDKHIAEAAYYEPKAKRISFKKNIFIAACFVVIAITVLYVNTFLSKPSVKQDETTSSAIETTKDDIFSDSSTNTTVGTTASSGVPPINYDDWENKSLPWYFYSVTFEGKTYQGCSSYCKPIESDKILQEIGRITVYDYVKQNKGEYIDLIIYEVEGISKDYAVAVKREDGLMQGAFLYIENCVFYDSQTIGELTDKLKLTDNLTISRVEGRADFTCYYYDGIFKDVSSKGINLDEDGLESIRNSFIALLKNNANSKKYNYNNRNKADVIHFHINLYGNYICVEVTSDGYIYIDDYYKANKKQCNEFISTVLNYSTSHNSELAKEIESCKTLGEFSEISSLSVQSSYWVYYCEDGESDILYSICVETSELINKLVELNSDVSGASRVCNAEEKFVFESSYNGKNGIPLICFCNDGYLYVSCESVTKGFYIGKDKYNDFKEEFKKTACVYTKDNPVTMG